MKSSVFIMASLMMVPTFITYIILSMEFPKRGCYEIDPLWLTFIKIWGGFFLMGFCFWLWANLFFLLLKV